MAVIVTDSDSTLSPIFGPFVHWIAYDIPSSQRGLREGIGTATTSLDSMRQGTNGFGSRRYSGPCPPGGTSHRYIFAVYAIDVALQLEPGVGLKDVNAAITGHIIAGGTVVGHYP